MTSLTAYYSCANNYDKCDYYNMFYNVSLIKSVFPHLCTEHITSVIITRCFTLKSVFPHLCTKHITSVIITRCFTMPLKSVFPHLCDYYNMFYNVSLIKSVFPHLCTEHITSVIITRCFTLKSVFPHLCTKHINKLCGSVTLQSIARHFQMSETEQRLGGDKALPVTSKCLKQSRD